MATRIACRQRQSVASRLSAQGHDADYIAKRFSVHARTIQRDLKLMREQGPACLDDLSDEVLLPLLDSEERLIAKIEAANDEKNAGRLEITLAEVRCAISGIRERRELVAESAPENKAEKILADIRRSERFWEERRERLGPRG
ncbi:HTH domain-containing protein [bacterium AH-315-M10]|nr:HTH domain-containing protein [bacterium AH-315-M10]